MDYQAVLLPLLPSLLFGLLVGMGIKRALRVTVIVAALAIVAAVVLAKYGLDSGMIEDWARSSASWIGDNAEGAGRYIAAFAPSIAAAVVGGIIGFRLL